MELTRGFEEVLPSSILDRYEVREVRNAGKILSSVDPEAFSDIMSVLSDFTLNPEHLLLPGGNEGLVARQINDAIRARGWRETRLDTTIEHKLVITPYTPAGERSSITRPLTTTPSEGYKADLVKNRTAGDMEWNAKDGNLDRNFASYRSLYETGAIDSAVLITRTHELIDLEAELIEELMEAGAAEAARITGFPEDSYAAAITRVERLRREGKNYLRLGTSTTTNLRKLEHRLSRGDGGGCPILVIAIARQTFGSVHLVSEPRTSAVPPNLEA